jgi:hypothetical protein
MVWTAALIAFAIYAWLAAPGMYWLDSEELGSAVVRLGVPHPTGFPLLCLLGQVASWIPFGELAFRVHLLSALGAAVAVGVVADLVVELGERLGAGELTACFGGAAAALVLGGSMTFFRQATVTEVYAPTAALIAIAIHMAVRMVGLGATPLTRQSRASLPGLALALVAGLGATGVHASFRLLLAVPFVLLYMWRLVRRRERWVVLAPFLLVLGMAGTALYLPLRSARVPELDWGHASTARGFVDHVTARRIRLAFHGEMFRGGARAAARLGALAEGDLGALALLAAAGGALALLLRARGRAAGALLLFVAAGDFAYSIWINPMGIDDRQDGVPFALAAAVLCGVGVAAGGRALGRAAPFAAAVCGVIVAAQPLAAGVREKVAASGTDAPRGYAEAALARCPPRAVALVVSDSLAGELYWLTLVEPVRPDVALLARQHLWDLARDRAVLGSDVPLGVDPLATILGTGRPIAWEIGPDASPPPGLRVALDVPIAGADAPDVRRSIARMTRVFAPPATDDEDGRRIAGRAFVALGVMAQGAGDLRTAVDVTERAVALDADDGIALTNAARYHLALGEIEPARRLARRAADGGRAAAFALLGVIAANEGKCDEARRLFDRALEIDPAQPDAKGNRARVETDCRPANN